MLPTDSAYGGWPASGEIDLTEVRGNANYQCWGGPFGRQLTGSTLHWGPTMGQNQWSKTHWEKYYKIVIIINTEKYHSYPKFSKSQSKLQS